MDTEEACATFVGNSLVHNAYNSMNYTLVATAVALGALHKVITSSYLLIKA